MKILKPYFKSADSRGEILGISQFDWMREINYIESHSGSTRGGHYHKKTTELFFIMEGEIKVSVKHLKSQESKEITVRKGDIFIVEPLEVHTFQIIKDARWINVLSHPMDKHDPDFFYVDAEKRP